jgi:hypothetical protein
MCCRNAGCGHLVVYVRSVHSSWLQTRQGGFGRKRLVRRDTRACKKKARFVNLLLCSSRQRFQHDRLDVTKTHAWCALQARTFNIHFPADVAAQATSAVQVEFTIVLHE